MNNECDCKDCQCGGTKQSTTAFDIWTAPDWSIFKNDLINWDEVVKQWNIQYKQYDPEKYDLVEKKDYKIKKLKEDIEFEKNLKIEFEKSSEYYIQKQLEYYKKEQESENKIKQLEQELQELESKKKE